MMLGEIVTACHTVVYPLFLRIYISNTKVVFLKQVVVIAHMVQQELAFGVPLQRNKAHRIRTREPVFPGINHKPLSSV